MLHLGIAINHQWRLLSSAEHLRITFKALILVNSLESQLTFVTSSDSFAKIDINMISESSTSSKLHAKLWTLLPVACLKGHMSLQSTKIMERRLSVSRFNFWKTRCCGPSPLFYHTYFGGQCDYGYSYAERNGDIFRFFFCN